MTTQVAALYVDRTGPYSSLPDVDAWDETRDARTYPGPHPVVAHPPCGPWGILRHLNKQQTHECAILAVSQVRRFGGVLEHPARSRLWAVCRLPRPGGFPDEHGGFALEVQQVSWGHVARKRTWLYIVGVPRATVYAEIRTGGAPTHWQSGSRTAPRGPVPAGIKVCSAEQRRRTPPEFARWLVSLAREAER